MLLYVFLLLYVLLNSGDKLRIVNPTSNFSYFSDMIFFCLLDSLLEAFLNDYNFDLDCTKFID